MKSTAVLRLGKCFKSIPTIMYMAPDGITGFRPGTADNSLYTALALAYGDTNSIGYHTHHLLIDFYLINMTCSVVQLPLTSTTFMVFLKYDWGTLARMSGSAACKMVLGPRILRVVLSKHGKIYTL